MAQPKIPHALDYVLQVRLTADTMEDLLETLDQLKAEIEEGAQSGTDRQEDGTGQYSFDLKRVDLSCSLRGLAPHDELAERLNRLLQSLQKLGADSGVVQGELTFDISTFQQELIRMLSADGWLTEGSNQKPRAIAVQGRRCRYIKIVRDGNEPTKRVLELVQALDDLCCGQGLLEGPIAESITSFRKRLLSKLRTDGWQVITMPRTIKMSGDPSASGPFVQAPQ